MPRKRPVAVAPESPADVVETMTTLADYHPVWTMRLPSADSTLPATVIATREDGRDLRADLIVDMPDGSRREIHGVLLVTADSRETGPRAVIRPL